MKNIIIFFPLGAGGNFVRNVMSLDTTFEFFDDSPFYIEYPTAEGRFEFLKKYYQTPVTPNTWLDREWTIRTGAQIRYFENNTIAYWNPHAKSIYLIHGEHEEMYNIYLDKKLSNFDKSGMKLGNDVERISPKGLQSCSNLFILPRDIELTSKIYASKNGKLNQFDQSIPVDERFKMASNHNKRLLLSLEDYKTYITQRSDKCITIAVEDLLVESGADLLDDICYRMNVNVPAHMIRELHSLWLQSTRDLYYTSYGEELKI